MSVSSGWFGYIRGWTTSGAVGRALIVAILFGCPILVPSAASAASAESAVSPTWTLLPYTPRSQAAEFQLSAYDASTKQLVLFEAHVVGSNGAGAQTWSWNGYGWVQLRPATTPAVPVNVEWVDMAYDAGTGQIILYMAGFGQAGNAPAFESITWAWNGSDWQQLVVGTAGTSPQAVGPMAYDQATGQLLLLSAPLSATGPGQTWTWNGTAWTVVGTTPKNDEASMAYDASSGQMLLYAGAPFSGAGSTWSWDGSTWTEVAAGGPPQRWLASMAYDPVTSELLLYGGRNAGAVGPASDLADTWAWSGTAWVQREAASSPGGREAGSLAYDGATGQLVLFGGDNVASTFLTDTWVWGDTDLQAHPQSSTASAGLSHYTFTISDRSAMDVTDVEVIIEVPPALTFTTAQVVGADGAAVGEGGPGGVSLYLAHLAAGQTATIHTNFRVDPIVMQRHPLPRSAVGRATVFSNTPDVDLSNNMAHESAATS